MSPLASHRRFMVARALSPGSIEKRMSILTRCENAIGHPLVDATTDELEAWLRSTNVSPRTRYAYISHLSSFFRWAVDEGLAAHDPTTRVARPKLRQGLPRPLSTADLQTIIAGADTMTAAMICLAAHAGLRCMEIANLDAVDVLRQHDPPVLVVSNGKGGKSRVVPMSPPLIEALTVYGLPRRGPVFTWHGQRLPAWRVSHLLRTHMLACGVEGSAHQLRHAFATEVYRKSGGDLRLTQELLGHSSPSTTAIYTAWSPERAAETVKWLYHDGVTGP